MSREVQPAQSNTDEICCRSCGWLKDTAEHAMGCEVGRAEIAAEIKAAPSADDVGPDDA